jgi:glycosyltransferase involved in cell wall biosynthesis
MANVFSSMPYAAASHNSRLLRRAVQTIAREGAADLLQYEWLAYADALPRGSRCRTLVMAHNIESQIWRRYWETECSVVRRLYLRQQWHRFLAYERSMLHSADGVVCVSHDDARLARELFGVRRAWVVENGIDRPYFQQAQGQRREDAILFVGSLDWRPNLDAVRLLLGSIFPEVRRQCPNARLWIVGRRPPDWLRRAVNESANVELHADVPDVRPYLASATVMAVPLRVGGGSRLKILEAMVCGLPVVSTAIGCEGLAVRPGHDLLVREVPQFAAALLWAMANPGAAEQIGQTARQLALAHYDWDVLAQRLESVWESLLRQVADEPGQKDTATGMQVESAAIPEV